MGREVAHPESCHPHGELGEIILHWNTVSTLEHTLRLHSHHHFCGQPSMNVACTLAGGTEHVNIGCAFDRFS